MLSNNVIKVKVFVDDRLATTVKVASDSELHDMLPELLRRVSRKGLGTLKRLYTRNHRITDLYIANPPKGTGKPKRRLKLLPTSPKVEARCIVSAPR